LCFLFMNLNLSFIIFFDKIFFERLFIVFIRELYEMRICIYNLLFY